MLVSQPTRPRAPRPGGPRRARRTSPATRPTFDERLWGAARRNYMPSYIRLSGRTQTGRSSLLLVSNRQFSRARSDVCCARVDLLKVFGIRPSDRRGPGPAGHRGRNVRSTGRCSYNLRITRRRADSCGLHRSTSQVIRRSGFSHSFFFSLETIQVGKTARNGRLGPTRLPCRTRSTAAPRPGALPRERTREFTIFRRTPLSPGVGGRDRSYHTPPAYGQRFSPAQGGVCVLHPVFKIFRFDTSVGVAARGRSTRLVVGERARPRGRKLGSARRSRSTGHASVFSPHGWNAACLPVTPRGPVINDPSAGSPTETLLRLLLPLNGRVRSSSAAARLPDSRRSKARVSAGPKTSLRSFNR